MVKIDTKEYFRIFHLSGEEVTEKMTEELINLLLKKRKEAPGNAILVLPEETDFTPAFFTELAKVQSGYLKDQLSFMITPIKENMKYPKLNHTRTLQEAIDMVMMEKIERDLTIPGNEDEEI